MPLIDLARLMLAAMRRKHDKDHRGDLGNPDGALISSSWLELRFSYDGRRRRVAMPAIILRDAGRDFQLGYIYGTLVQRLRPPVGECPDCGKLKEPLYRFSGGEISRADHGHEGSAC